MKDWRTEAKNIALFEDIPEHELYSMLACINPQIKTFSRGEIVARMHEPMTSIGVVLQGEAEVMRESASGVKNIMGRVKQGETFGELAAFSSSPVWPATVTAKTDLTLMFIPITRFLGNCPKSCQSHKTLIQNMLRVISDKSLQLDRKVEYLSVKGMRSKICAYLLEQYRLNKSATFVLPMNKSDLADYLGVSRPSMVREFSRLKDEGIIDYYLSSVRILDMDALKSCAM
ncbi:MAG: Crp/Fnr family transcriptional regulator [Burkholderiales bacterium]